MVAHLMPSGIAPLTQGALEECPLHHWDTLFLFILLGNPVQNLAYDLNSLPLKTDQHFSLLNFSERMNASPISGAWQFSVFLYMVWGLG